MMNFTKVPHLPIENFNPSELEASLSSLQNEEEKFISDLFGGDRGNSFREKSTKDIAIILHGMGMEKYLSIFQNESIDLDTFLHLTDNDLQELGIENAQHRDLMLQSLKTHHSSQSSFSVLENHIEDLKIAKNIENEMLVLRNYCAYVNIQLKKQKLTDYRISSTETAALYLKNFTELCLTQIQRTKNLLFNSNENNHLIGKALKVYNLTLPKHMEEKLRKKKSKNKKVFLKVAVVVGFSSSLILLGRYLTSRR